MTGNIPNRAIRRQCRALGHIYKTDGHGNRFCARCREPLPEEERSRWFRTEGNTR